MLAVTAALLAVLAVLYAWQLFPFAGSDERTDNAYVRGSVTIIGPQVSGYVTSVPGVDFAPVRQGQIVATIDDRIYQARVGQRANFTVDALGGVALAGRIESMAPAVGSEFTVIKPDNATGNFVKVAQRIAVRIGIDPQASAARLRPGMSVEVRIATR